MPKMPESEKKEESAESREEAKEQVRLEPNKKIRTIIIFMIHYLKSSQERLKAAEAKRIEKERTEKYQKLKGEAKDSRAKYREKVG